MRGRIPNSIKQHVQADFNKYGVSAWHYYCYNINWSEPLSDYDSRYLSALSKLVERVRQQCLKV